MNTADVAQIVYQELLKVAGGAAIVLAALSAFLGKIWIARIANRESQRRETEVAQLRSQLDRQSTELKAQLDRQGAELKAQLDVSVQRTVFVDKLQFEHEYSIYKQAWKRLFALQQTTLAIRPTFDRIDPNESKEERIRRRLGSVAAPYNEFSKLVECNRPFFPEKVYGTLVAVRNKCLDEIDDSESTDAPQKEYWAEARKNHSEIIDLINQACEAIRTRVAEVRVA